MPTPTAAYAALSAGSPLEPFSITRRDPLPNDVAIDILYCGVCHSDLHAARGDRGGGIYPCVPGHEIIGRVTAVGADVTRFTPGDIVGVGCMVDSCGHCHPCDAGDEQHCEGGGFVGTYGGRDQHLGGYTYGGYSRRIVVKEDFVLTIRHDEKDLAAVAPLLCAGITTWAPLRRRNVGPGQKVGVVGLGGLGHVGVKLAVAMGAEVHVFSTSDAKRDDALRLGAKSLIVSKNADDMEAHTGTFDLIIDTVSASHDINALLQLLRYDGQLCLLGVPEKPHPSPNVGTLIWGRRSIAGSLIGGIADTQEMLDFCHEHGITSDVEMIEMAEIDTAFDRMLKSEVRYRFVIDMGSLPPVEGETSA